MASREDLVLRFVFSSLLMVMTGINVWQYATATEYDAKGTHRPMMKRLFLIEAVITFIVGLYLVVSTTLIA